MPADTLLRELIAVIEPDGRYTLDWRDGYTESGAPAAEFQRNWYAAYLADRDKALLFLGTEKKDFVMAESVEYLYRVAAAYVGRLCRNPDLEALREAARAVPEEEDQAELLAEIPYMYGAEYVDGAWLTAAWERLNGAFAGEMRRHPGSVAEYFAGKNPDIHFAGKVYFHLVENKDGEYPFAFLATYAAEPSATGRAKHLPLQNALKEYGQNSKKLLALLATVHKTARQSPFIAGLLETGEIFHPIGLNPDEAYTFLREVPAYEAAGVLCRIPAWWRKKTNSLKIAVSVGSKEPSRLGLDALLDFRVQLSLGGETVTPAELKKLAAESAGLAFLKGKWVEVNPERLRETLAAYEQAQSDAQREGISLLEALRLQLSAARILNVPDQSCEVEVSNGQWLASVLGKLQNPAAVEAVDAGPGFRATLRDYQRKGLQWLYTLKRLGFGACLADDMGLGKTVQVLALLNRGRAEREEKVLLIVPASLIANWTAEIDRFAPGLNYRVLHPQENKQAAAREDGGGICLTTYGLVPRLDWLKETEWDTVILDEAQAIKNPGTKQAKAVKQLKTRSRIALTGTPVENRLADLWSIFDFLNKGLLGSAREFTQYSKKLQASGAGYGKLRQSVSPFILRRLKSDRSVIADLPEKVEMKTYAALSKRQAALYSSVVDGLQERLERSEGIERKGLVLAALLKFKQICNHPDQYLGQEVYAADESGKYERLREIGEIIYARRERVLVFTQFREMTAPLQAFLQTVFHHEGLVLHGGTPVAKRKEIVAAFQGQDYVPFMVLSIKAGGVGLNLTAANHVVHFDRWWNPAVENQATDRAFRIGQQKNVLVHKFITKGTVEEKIDRLIEEKIKMTREIVPDISESFLTEMDNKQLLELFRLE